MTLLTSSAIILRSALRAAARAPRGTAVWSSILSMSLLAGVVLSVELQAIRPTMVAVDTTHDTDLGESTRIVDRDGRLLARLDEGFDRHVVPLARIPRRVRDAIVAIEDGSFWEHGGVDARALIRALVANIARGEVSQGGSTITMQLARNAVEAVGRERTMARKAREIAAALQLEDRMPKREILARYLNLVYLGRGAYGVDAGARAWFGVPVHRLDLPAAATLAALIHAPSSYAGRPDALRRRRNLVLHRMGDLGMIGAGRAERAAATPLSIAPDRRSRVRAPYFVSYVTALLRAPVERGGFGLTAHELFRGGYVVRTTLDLRIQRAAERAVTSVANRRGDPEAALIALSTTGKVRAMIGGRSQRHRRARGFNFAAERASGAGRPAGSTFKPFTLAAYLDDGLDPTRSFPAPASTIVEGCGATPWEVSNYGHAAYGALDAIRATELSVNTVFAQMVAEVGPDQVVRMAHRLGITAPLAPVCSLTLGPSGVTPLEMARAYGSFATRGVRYATVAVTRIEGPKGAVVARGGGGRARVLDREVADGVNAILEGVVAHGTGAPAAIGRPAAGKTGTTEDVRDLWFVGYTPHPGLVAAVWVGHRDGSPVLDAPGRPATGGGFAGAIWSRFMRAALRGLDVRTFADVTFRTSEEEPVVIERVSPDTVVVHQGNGRRGRGRGRSGHPHRD